MKFAKFSFESDGKNGLQIRGSGRIAKVFPKGDSGWELTMVFEPSAADPNPLLSVMKAARLITGQRVEEHPKTEHGRRKRHSKKENGEHTEKAA